MAVYEVTLRGSLFGEMTINRWHYVVDNSLATPSAVELLTLMGFIYDYGVDDPPDGTVFRGVWDMSSVDQLWEEVEGRNLYSVSDFLVQPISPSQAGGHDAGAAAPFLAFGYRSNRVRTDIRRGYKRFGGVAEDALDGGGVIAAAFVTSGAVLATEMGATLGTGSTLYKPAVLAEQKYTTPSGKFAYRPYATEAEQVDHAAFPVSWELYADVRSQVSRQYGRGS